jgi:hypothetical protein
VVGLEKGGELVTVATVRVYGDKVAELPLEGTRFAYRRQGMLRLLMTELEKRLVLPAVPELLRMWTTASLGFSYRCNGTVYPDSSCLQKTKSSWPYTRGNTTE